MPHGVKPMFGATITMVVPAEKLSEVLQTFKAILDPIRQERGCISCHCYMDVEVGNTVVFVEEWQTHKDLKCHLKSDHFGVLMGAMKLLQQAPDFRFNTIASTAGAEAVRAARA